MLFQKKQNSYQSYGQNQASGNRNKLIILATLVSFILIAGVASAVLKKDPPTDSPAQRNSSLTQYKSVAPGLSLSIYAPKDLQLKNSGFDATIGNSDSTESIVISKFFESDGQDDASKLDKLVLKDIYGNNIPGIKSEEKMFYGKRVTVVTRSDKPSTQDYYINTNGYTWLLSFKWDDSHKDITKFAAEIVTSLQVSTDNKSNYLTE